MATDPKDNVGTRVKAQPLDDNQRPLSAMLVPIVEAGEIVGYLPVKGIDNSDGTATLASTVSVTLDADVDIGNIHLLNIADAKINPATEEKQDAIITAIGAGIGIDPVGLKNSSAALIDPATEGTLAAIKAKTDLLTFINTSLDVTESVATALAADPSTAIGTRLKHYQQTNDIVDSPVTFNVKADMDTQYTKTDSSVRFLIVTKPSQDISINVTSADGTSEDIFVKKGEIFNISNFDIVSFKVIITTNGTQLRLLAEGF